MDVIKYGYPIGHVMVPVRKGAWISEHEIKTNLSGLLEYAYRPVEVSLDIPDEKRTFRGYRRKNGDAGIPPWAA